MADLSEYLKGDKPPVIDSPAVETPPQEAQPETPVESAKADRARDESGRFVKGDKPEAEQTEKPVEAKPKEEAAPPAAKVEPKAKPPEVSGLEAGIAAERNKRQAAEQRAADLEARFKALEQRLNPPPPPPDPVANPQEFTQSIEQRFQAMAINHKVDTSVAVARVRHADFDEVMQEFAAMPPQEAQALYFQAIQSADPALHVYQTVKRAQMLKEIGDDPSAYRQRIEAELRQQLEAEYAARTPAPPPIVAPPPSLASARSNGRMSEPVWSGPPPLSSVFKR